MKNEVMELKQHAPRGSLGGVDENAIKVRFRILYYEPKTVEILELNQQLDFRFTITGKDQKSG